jgi:hypothetical protein
MGTTSYTLRAIDTGLMRRFKTRAAAEGKTTKQVLLESMEAYAKGHLLNLQTQNLPSRSPHERP